MRLLPVFVLIILFSGVTLPLVSSQPNYIILSVEPSTVNYPSSIPSSGPSFSELLFINFSKPFENQTFELQYRGAQGWANITSIHANPEGFIQYYLPVTTRWAQPGVNILRIVTQDSDSNSASLVVKTDTPGYLGESTLYGGVIAAAFIAFILSRRLPRKAFLIAAAILYLGAAAFTGQRYDMYFMISAGVRILDGVNPFNPGNPGIYPFALKWAYPPAYAYYSAFAFYAYHLITGAAIPKAASLVYPGYATATYSVWRGFVSASMPVLALLVKLPLIASVFGVYLILERTRGHKIAASYWLANPLVFVVGSLWGQLDPVATLFAVASLYEYSRGNLGRSFLYASAGAAVKVWPGLLIPIFLAQMAARNRRSIYKMVWALPALVLSLLGYAVFGGLGESLFIFAYSRGVPTYAGEFTVNGLTWQQILFVARSPPLPIFLYAGLPLYALIVYYAYRRPSANVCKLAILALLILFLTYNYVNPQYFLWIIPLLLMVEMDVYSLAYTLLPGIYLALSYNMFYFVSPAILYDQYAFPASIVEQLKISVFYSLIPVYLMVTAVAPTLVYALTAAKVTGLDRRIDSKGYFTSARRLLSGVWIRSFRSSTRDK